MKPSALFLALVLLIGCHSTRKTISRAQAKETSQFKQVSSRADSSSVETTIQDRTIDVSQLIKSGEQLTQTLTERYAPSGNLIERTTTVKRRRIQERAQSDVAQVNHAQRSVVAQQASKASIKKRHARAAQVIPQAGETQGDGVLVCVVHRLGAGCCHCFDMLEKNRYFSVAEKGSWLGFKQLEQVPLSPGLFKGEDAKRDPSVETALHSLW